MAPQNHEIAVLMIPLPCQSHLNQLLQLSAALASRHIPVHFVGTATHNRQARLRSHGPNPTSIVHFHDLPTPPIAVPDPDPHASDKTPNHLFPATEAYFNLRKPIGALATQIALKSRRIVVVYDRMMAEAARDAVLVPNSEAYAFNCLSAFNLFYILWEAWGRPVEVAEEIRDLPSVREFIPEAALQFIAAANVDEREGDIHNTCRLVDGKYVDLLGRREISGGKKQWALRPGLVAKPKSGNKEEGRHKCLDWLDKQAPRSVIYVSFGTTTSFTNEEAREVAIGLEASKQRFIWVLRDADRGDIFVGEGRQIELPEGFEDRVREDGVVVRDWAPQMEILSHGSTGGFMSHCGWNSCFESLITGVPVVAWPIHSDQPFNAIFLTESLGVGVRVGEWKREGMVTAGEVKEAVVRLMATEEGEEMRRRAEEVSVGMKETMQEGGESYKEMEAFIAHITR